MWSAPVVELNQPICSEAIMFPVMTAYKSEKENTASALLDKVIQQAGGIPYQVSNLTAAVQLLKEQHPAILIIGERFDGSNILDVLPIFKHLQKNIKIILLADDATEGFLRQARAAGIFYHALEPQDKEDCQELKLALECAKEASEEKTPAIWKRLAPLFRAHHVTS